MTKLKTFEYIPVGVCSKNMQFKIENNIITFQKKDIYEYLGFTKTPFSIIIKDKR